MIGNHYREDFAGIDVMSTTTPVQRGVVPELILPVTYYFENQGYRPKGYSVMTHERPGLHAGGVWNQTCIFCHNTVPMLDTLLGELAGPSPPGYQGVAVDRLLPPDRAVWLPGRPARPPSQGHGRRTRVRGRRTPRPSRTARRRRVLRIRALARRFQGRHLIEVGIGCESCHGGGRAHAPILPCALVAPLVLLTSEPAHALVRRAGGPRPCINRTCARCHQVLFSRYPFTWEGGLRRDPDPGGSSINSGEARDFLLGALLATWPARPATTRTPATNPAHLAELATPAGNGVCLRCHARSADAEALAAHAHHDPDGAGWRVHRLPHAAQEHGARLPLTRYHRIGSPTDRARVEGDRPLECALCHADKSVAELVGRHGALVGQDTTTGAAARALRRPDGRTPCWRRWHAAVPTSKSPPPWCWQNQRSARRRPRWRTCLPAPTHWPAVSPRKPWPPCWTALAPSMSMPPGGYTTSTDSLWARPAEAAIACARATPTGQLARRRLTRADSEFWVSGCNFLTSVASKVGVKASELAQWKQRLVALRTEILAEGDVAIEPVRKDDTRVGSEEDEQPLVEMSQVIASKRNRSAPWRLRA